MLKSPLRDLTYALGATVENVGSWELIKHYGTPQEEYRHTYSGAVLRDTSHLSHLKISGTDHLAFLHRMSTNHFNELAPGHGLQGVLPDHRGRMLAVGSFCRLDHSTLAILGPSERDKLPSWFERYIFSEDIAIEDLYPEIAMVDLFGPQALILSHQVLDIDLEMVSNHHLIGVNDSPMPWFIRTDRGGMPGVRVLAPADQLKSIWTKLQNAGAVPMGEQIWDTCRIEAGIPLPDHELTELYNPWEAGLGQAIHMDKGCYIGQEVIARLDTYDKIKQNLLGLKLSTAALPPPNSLVYQDGKVAGTITSCTYSPRLNSPIALAYIRRAYCEPGTQLNVESTDATQIAQVVSLPFI